MTTRTHETSMGVKEAERKSSDVAQTLRELADWLDEQNCPDIGDSLTVCVDMFGYKGPAPHGHVWADRLGCPPPQNPEAHENFLCRDRRPVRNAEVVVFCPKPESDQ